MILGAALKQLNPFTVAQIAIKAGQQCQDGNANTQFLLKASRSPTPPLYADVDSRWPMM